MLRSSVVRPYRTASGPTRSPVLGAEGSCTGTLIAPDVVITAGHCAEINPTSVIANTTDYAAQGGAQVNVKATTAYPDWQHDLRRHRDRARAADPERDAAQGRDRLHVPGASLAIRRSTSSASGHTTANGTGSNTLLNEAMAPVVDPDCSQGNGCHADGRARRRVRRGRQRHRLMLRRLRRPGLPRYAARRGRDRRGLARRRWRVDPVRRRRNLRPHRQDRRRGSSSTTRQARSRRTSARRTARTAPMRTPRPSAAAASTTRPRRCRSRRRARAARAAAPVALVAHAEGVVNFAALDALVRAREAAARRALRARLTRYRTGWSVLRVDRPVTARRDRWPPTCRAE